MKRDINNLNFPEEWTSMDHSVTLTNREWSYITAYLYLDMMDQAKQLKNCKKFIKWNSHIPSTQYKAIRIKKLGDALSLIGSILEKIDKSYDSLEENK